MLGVCPGCKRFTAVGEGGVCRPCRPKKPRKPPCPGCGKRLAPRPSGLCRACDRRARVACPKCGVGRVVTGLGVCRNCHGPTDAELDALVAERMQSLPDWWADPAHDEDDRPPKLAKLFRRRP